ncbi:MAG: rRNA maturation RNase YbeY [Desulfovibrio sp.]|jgi:probable rRNA maturation factor|nr:rRNA maturation RNase YbeY [Desulfovibrio sp.]
MTYSSTQADLAENFHVQVSVKAGVALKTPLEARLLRKVLACFAAVAGLGEATLELIVIDDADMEILQRQSLDRDGPTNILSFPAAKNFPCTTRARKNKAADPVTFPGGLALSADTLEREAFLYGQDKADYCLRLLAHGFTHLLGHVHGPAMAKVEDRLRKAGLELIASDSQHIHRIQIQTQA